jgi:hypothetical protein
MLGHPLVLAPDGSFVALGSAGLVVISPSGEPVVRVIDSPPHAARYLFTPDSQHIVYVGLEYVDLQPVASGLYSTAIPPDAAGSDDDGDGFGGACDCSPDGPEEWAIPGETVAITFADRTRLDWQAPAGPGGTSARYDVLRSDAASDFAGAGASCVESDDVSDRTALDPDTPLPGAVYFYLVRAENGCGGGSLGTASDGTPRAGRECP